MREDGGFGPCLRSSLALDLRFAHGSRLFPRTPSQRCGEFNRGHAAPASGRRERTGTDCRFDPSVSAMPAAVSPAGRSPLPSREFVGCPRGRQFAPGLRAARAPATILPPLRRPARVR